MHRHLPMSPLFPYTTLFRSYSAHASNARKARLARARAVARAREEARLRALQEAMTPRSEEHTSELQSLTNLVCRLLLEKKKKKKPKHDRDERGKGDKCIRDK